MIGSANDDSNFSHILLLNDKEIWNLCKAFTNKLYRFFNVKLSEIQTSKNIQGKFSVKLLDSLIKNWLSLAKIELVLPTGMLKDKICSFK